VVIVGFDGTVLYGNPAAYAMIELGSPSSSPLHIRDFLSPESIDRVYADLATIQSTREPVIGEYTLITRSGKIRTIEAAGHWIQWNGQEADLVSNP
jgi:PAS domain-containing protein